MEEDDNDDDDDAGDGAVDGGLVADDDVVFAAAVVVVAGVDMVGSCLGVCPTIRISRFRLADVMDLVTRPPMVTPSFLPEKEAVVVLTIPSSASVSTSAPKE